MPILNYTTDIAVHRSVAEIQRTLSRHGAREVSVVYGAGGVISGVRFVLEVAGQEVTFRLPANPEGVLRALQAAPLTKHFTRRHQTAEHAERVAWRILKDWTEAQLALVEANQAEAAEVFLPYAVVDGRTAWQAFQATVNARSLTAGGGL
jgi:hypothetical protein